MPRPTLNGHTKTLIAVVSLIVVLMGIVVTATTAHVSARHEIQANRDDIAELKEMGKKLHRIELIVVKMAALDGIEVP